MESVYHGSKFRSKIPPSISVHPEHPPQSREGTLLFVLLFILQDCFPEITSMAFCFIRSGGGHPQVLLEDRENWVNNKVQKSFDKFLNFFC